MPDPSTRQARLIAALLDPANRTQAEAAAAAGIPMRTAARWFKDPDFKQALRQAETAAIDGAVRKLVSGAAAAVDVLVELLDPAVDVSNRRHAAKSLLDALVRLRDTMTTEERLTILEERLERK